MHAIVLDFFNGEIVDEHVFISVKQTWFESMRTLRALHLPGEVSHPLHFIRAMRLSALFVARALLCRKLVFIEGDNSCLHMVLRPSFFFCP